MTTDPRRAVCPSCGATTWHSYGPAGDGARCQHAFHTCPPPEHYDEAGRYVGPDAAGGWQNVDLTAIAKAQGWSSAVVATDLRRGMVLATGEVVFRVEHYPDRVYAWLNDFGYGGRFYAPDALVSVSGEATSDG